MIFPQSPLRFGVKIWRFFVILSSWAFLGSLLGLPQHYSFDFRCSPDVSPQDLGSGWVSEPQRGPTVAFPIIPPALQFRFSVLPRRLPPGSRLWLGFRAPERANSSCSNHSPSTTVSIFGAPQTSLSICTCVSSMISMSLYAHTHKYTQKPS